jgi:L-threonylcarbamoyladenylate synthase
MLTQLLDATDPGKRREAIDEAARLIERGEVVAFPTETVYGLGALAFDPKAIERVFAAKGRPADNPLIVHVGNIPALDACGLLGEDARRVAERFMPGPLTIVVEARTVVPQNARAGLPTVALRMPDHPVALELLARTGPLVAPSANLSGRPSPTTARHVLDDLDGRIAAVLDGGRCNVGIESTVLDMSDRLPQILRPGEISSEQIAEVLGVMPEEPLDTITAKTKSPGTKYRHYSPRVPLRLVIDPNHPQLDPDRSCIILTPQRHVDSFPGFDVRLLTSETLYNELRAADDANVSEVVIYAAPGELSSGLLDRVRRAAGHHDQEDV